MRYSSSQVALTTWGCVHKLFLEFDSDVFREDANDSALTDYLQHREHDANDANDSSSAEDSTCRCGTRTLRSWRTTIGGCWRRGTGA